MESRKIAYIAGKVSGLDHEQVTQKFAAKQQHLEQQGYIVYNPVQILNEVNAKRVEDGAEPLQDDRNREMIMKHCLSIMMVCDEVHLLHDWQDSPGALKEVSVAKLIPMPIIYP